MLKVTKNPIFIGIFSFLIVLFTMPLGHALMILMEHYMQGSALHSIAFAMGFVGLLLTLIGMFRVGDTTKTIYGLFGGLLFWTGWIEFVYIYYANRFGVEPLIVGGEVVTKPEYLIMPTSFGFWVMFMLIYIFSIPSGCNFFNYIQRKLLRSHREKLVARPVVRNTALTTFMELNLMLWTSYLLLLFLYDDHFIGDDHFIVILIAIAALVGSLYMFRKLIKIQNWGHSIRYAIATVIVFWTFVEIMGRLNLLKEIWVEPLQHKNEVLMIFIVFVLVMAIPVFLNIIKKKKDKKA